MCLILNLLYKEIWKEAKDSKTTQEQLWKQSSFGSIALMLHVFHLFRFGGGNLRWVALPHCFFLNQLFFQCFFFFYQVLLDWNVLNWTNISMKHFYKQTIKTDGILFVILKRKTTWHDGKRNVLVFIYIISYQRFTALSNLFTALFKLSLSNGDTA